MTLSSRQFELHLAEALGAMPPGTTADLTDCIVAYWNGKSVAYAFLCGDGSGKVDEDFDLDDYVWAEWHPSFAEWLAKPTFSVRTEVRDWVARKSGHFHQ
jgi:hypothetical protein